MYSLGGGVGPIKRIQDWPPTRPYGMYGIPIRSESIISFVNETYFVVSLNDCIVAYGNPKHVS